MSHRDETFVLSARYLGRLIMAALSIVAAGVVAKIVRNLFRFGWDLL